MSGDAVTVSWVHDSEVAYSFCDSLLNLLLFDAAHEQHILRGGYIPMRCARSGDLVEARNKVAAAFLKRDSDWLLIIDTDMGFKPDTLEQLLAVADPEERPIVGALCFAQREIARDGFSGFRTVPRSTILDWVKIGDESKIAGRTAYPVNTVTRCAATGSAAILIHRSVFERIRDEYGSVWYNRVGGSDGSLLGEDVSFCIRAGALDIPIYVHTGVRTSHLKNVWLGEDAFWDYAIAPPAAAQTNVIVPVMSRPQNAEPFMRSLRASTGMADVYAVAHQDDTETIKAWQEAGAVVIEGDVTTFAEKINEGYRYTEAPWLFITGDDVTFHPGWLDHAQAVAGDDFHVIGTNDLGNSRVVAGEHATHMLIRRSYVDDVGASWDAPGVVCHEGYRHWFVDDEVVNAAKQRGAWAMALGSVVEHLHPAWGKGETDEVYKLGAEHATKDRLLFEKRIAAHLGQAA